MRLEFGEKYKSIDRFRPVDLAQFSIMTGKNGSGKTHLLESIKRGSCRIDSVATRDIVLFDLIAFTIENEQECGTRQITEEKRNAWSILKGQIRNPVYNIDVLTNLANKFLTREEKGKIKSIAAAKSKPLMQLEHSDFKDEIIAVKFAQYVDKFHRIFSDSRIKDNPAAKGTCRLAERLDVFIDEINQARFVHDYEATVLKEDFLPAQLGTIFMNYRLNEYIDARPDHGNGDISAPERKPSSTGYGPRYGTTPPWDIINQFFTAYTGGKYSVTFPAPLTSSEIVYGSRTFLPQLRNKEKNIEIDYNSLSSGEKVLFMLALCMFKAESETVFPKLLLLDEVDATLHPSMIKNLLRVVTGVLNKKGTTVVLATHSPTTVSLAPDDCTYLVNPEGEERIVKSSKRDAVAILSEGYMTLDEGLHLLDQISSKQLIVISEGDNAAYIEAAIKLFAPSWADKIEVYDKIRDSSGAGQLRILFTFFSRTEHKTPIVIVWDPDYKDKGHTLTSSNNTHPFVLSPSPTTMAKGGGIESLFPEECFLRGELTRIDRPGHPLESHFDTDQKALFKDRMIKNANREWFSKFKELVDYIVSQLPQGAAVHHDRRG